MKKSHEIFIFAALGLSLTDKECSGFFAEIIKGAIKHREKTGEIREDFLQFMLETRNGNLKTDDSGDAKSCSKYTMKRGIEKLSDDYIISQSILFIFAGFDTTQSLLLFTIYELAICPHVQEKLANEVRRSRSTIGGTFTYECINQLEYLDKVINGMPLLF